MYQPYRTYLAKKTWGILGMFCRNGEYSPHKERVMEAGRVALMFK